MCPESDGGGGLIRKGALKEHLEFFSRKTERAENFRAPMNVSMFGQRHITAVNETERDEWFARMKAWFTETRTI